MAVEVGSTPKKAWLQNAKKSMQRRGTVGSFTAWCRSKGYDGVTDACIREGLKVGGVIAKKARFAKAVRSFRKK